MHNLYFGGVGYRDGDDIVEIPRIRSLVNVAHLVRLADAVNGSGYYWATPSSGSNATYFKFGRTSSSLVNLNLILLELGVLDFNGFSSTVATTTDVNFRKNIRCVRNSAFANKPN